MTKVLRTDRFVQDYNELSQSEKKQVIKTLRLLEENPAYPSLQVHRIKGTPFWEAYANKSVRIIFDRSSDTILLLACGQHDILKKY